VESTMAEVLERRRRRVTRVIVRYTELVSGPEEDHSIVLRFLYQVFAESSDLVSRFVLEWYADEARVSDLAPGISVALFEEFRAVLGPRPRRSILLSMLRDLIVIGYVSQSIGGFGTTAAGTALLESFSVKN